MLQRQGQRHTQGRSKENTKILQVQSTLSRQKPGQLGTRWTVASDIRPTRTTKILLWNSGITVFRGRRATRLILSKVKGCIRVGRRDRLKLGDRVLMQRQDE